LRIARRASLRRNEGDQCGKTLAMKKKDATRLKMEGNNIDGHATLGSREMP
jgi:hypothetical protein